MATFVAVVVAFTLAGLAAPVADASNENDRTTDGFEGYTPGGEIPRRGGTDTVELYWTPAFVEEDDSIPTEAEVRVEFDWYYLAALSHCDADDVCALGIDRCDDLPGTEYDAGLLRRLSQENDYETGPQDDPGRMTTDDDWDYRKVDWLAFPDPDDRADPLHVHVGRQEDEPIVASDDCVEMPESGWHRTDGYLNGTVVLFHYDCEQVTVDGESYEAGELFDIREPSLRYPVYECEESRHVGTWLDPPPGATMRGAEGGLVHPDGPIEDLYVETNESGYITDDLGVSPTNVRSDGSTPRRVSRVLRTHLLRRGPRGGGGCRRHARRHTQWTGGGESRERSTPR